MPDLPTLTVTQPQADRMLAVYGSVGAYKTWLKATIKAYILAEEARRAAAPYEDQARAVRAAIAADDPLAGAT